MHQCFLGLRNERVTTDWRDCTVCEGPLVELGSNGLGACAA